MSKENYVIELCESAKTASRQIAQLDDNKKRSVLKAIAAELRASAMQIIEANKSDVENARSNGLSDAMIDRLLLNEKRIDSMASSIEDIAQLPDPVGRVENMKTMPSGIRVGQMRVPVGVIAVIFESRPNVTADIAALAIKSGNAAILRGGKEAISSNRAIHAVISGALKRADVDANAVRLIDDLDYAVVDILLKQNRYIDIVIPRGGEKLIKMVSEKSTIPVIKHDKGVCHIFVDKSADPSMAASILVNAKVQRPGTCNSVETLLIHKDYPAAADLLSVLSDHNVVIRGDDSVRSVFPAAQKATEEDWDTEYLDLIISAKTVSSYEDAVAHITRYSSGHSEAIITSDYFNAERFLKDVDSAAVLINASTRFHDGGEFGLGAEVGISTQKLHARGAMGIEGLTCLKFIVYGSGQVRS